MIFKHLPKAGLFNHGKMRVQEWIATCVLMFAYIADKVNPPTVNCDKAVVELSLLALSVALSYLAGRLLAKRNKNQFDDKPTSLAQRGAFLQRIIGRRRCGILFGWAGERRTRDEKMAGGKGGGLFSGPTQTVYIEDGWHQICVGPAHALHRVFQNGQIIFQGPITSVSHPSGSTIDLGKEGSFRIFWGEFNQPQNTYLGTAERVGVSSRWPGTCYIEWRSKRLGPSAVWPIMEYEIEVRPQSTILTATPAYMEPTEFLLTGPIASIFDTEPGAPGTGYFQFNGNLNNTFKPGQRVRIDGHSTVANQDLDIRKVDVVVETTAIGFWPDGSVRYTYATRTNVYTDNITITAGSGGTLQVYNQSEDDGLNLAHVLAELLFETNGYGLGFDQDKWDMQALEDLGQRCEDENLRGAVLCQDGVEYRSIIGGILQDLGVMMPVDPLTGKVTFVPIRKPEGILPLLSEALQTSLPEIEIQHGPRPADQIVYSFSDRLNGYHDMTLGQMDDGQMTYLGLARARTAQIISTCNFETANVVAERRALEDLSGGARIQVACNRAARYLYPGLSVLVDGLEDIMRIVSIEPVDALSGDVQITMIPDYYGADASTFVQNRGNTGPALEPAEVDEQYIVVEVPEYLLNSNDGITLLVPRVRAHSTIVGTDLSISRDDVTYTPRGRDVTLMTGGLFIGALAANGHYNDTSSPQVTVNIDAASALDLSADEASYRAGRQILIMEDEDGNQEIAFLKKLTLVSGTTYTLDGIIRARYDTQRLDITAGCRFFILQSDDGLPVQDVLLEPQVPIYVKSQPFGLGQVTLAEVTPEVHFMYGKGVRPVPVTNIHMDICRLFYEDGTDVEVEWRYTTPRTAPSAGAGQQGAGQATSTVAPEGEFVVEFLTALDVVVRTETMTANSFSYTAAQRSTDFGGEPTSLKIRVTQLRGGYSSDAVTQTFVKV